jgi:hypothetical protein
LLTILSWSAPAPAFISSRRFAWCRIRV